MPLERRKQILELIYRNGFVKVSELSKQFNVNVATIRRDLKIIAKQHNINISYGGASLDGDRSLVREKIFEDKVSENLEQKEIIAKKAASLIRSGDTIALNAGSTVPLILDYLDPQITSLTVITLGLNIVNKVVKLPFINLILPGGHYRHLSHTFWGPHAEKMLLELNIDKAFLGANSIDMERGWTHPNLYEVETNRILMKNSQKRFLTAVSEKFDKVALQQICDLRQFDAFIVDDKFPAHYKAFAEQNDIEII